MCEWVNLLVHHVSLYSGGCVVYHCPRNVYIVSFCIVFVDDMGH